MSRWLNARVSMCALVPQLLPQVRLLVAKGTSLEILP